MADSDMRMMLDSISERLDRLDEAIRGNGRPGITTRLDRLERLEAFTSRLLWLILAAGATAAAVAIFATA